MKITVCELPNDPAPFKQAWQALLAHVAAAQSDLVLLPEMPFHPWLAWTRRVDLDQWDAAVAAHDRWLARLDGLPAAIGSRPTVVDGLRYNEGFIWEPATGDRSIHTKYYLPDDERFWEATWYHRGGKVFDTFQYDDWAIGMLLCTELWFSEHARAYARQGAHLLVCPRATELFSADKWLVGGQAAAIMGGAYCASSNRSGSDSTGLHWGGRGWIIDPDGVVLGVTTSKQPFLTLDIDLQRAESAKMTYPRYVRE